jgi:ABC-2 type transport system ATP-binding protein
MDVISCKRLTKRFGSVVAVRGLDLGVSAGQVYGFLGPNGAGKTTTIRMLVGLITPTEGQIRLLGRLLPDSRAVAVIYGYETGLVRPGDSLASGLPPRKTSSVSSPAVPGR